MFIKTKTKFSFSGISSKNLNISILNFYTLKSAFKCPCDDIDEEWIFIVNWFYICKKNFYFENFSSLTKRINIEDIAADTV